MLKKAGGGAKNGQFLALFRTPDVEIGFLA